MLVSIGCFLVKVAEHVMTLSYLVKAAEWGQGKETAESKSYDKHYFYLKTLTAQARDPCYPQACLFFVSTLSAVK